MSLLFIYIFGRTGAFRTIMVQSWGGSAAGPEDPAAVTAYD
jgi:hypothetical protein